MKKLTWQNPEQLFVAQVLINKVKSKCCGIKDSEKYGLFVTIFMFRIVAESPEMSTKITDRSGISVAVRADKAFNDCMAALNRHDVDAVREIIAINSDLLRISGTGIDIRTGIK